MDPYYSAAHCTPAYQLRWSLALFPNTPVPAVQSWLSTLCSSLAADDIRVLQANVSPKGALLLLLSTQPLAKPDFIVQCAKGRLQYLLRQQNITWRRNFRLTTLGGGKTEAVEKYVEQQLQHHKLVSEKSQQDLAELSWSDPEVKIVEPIYSSHAQYILGLHVVLVHSQRWTTVETGLLQATQQTILKTAAEQNCQVSRIGILADHIHATVRFHYKLAPGELALALMNAVAQRHRMRLWSDSYYVGTIGPYDMDAVRN
ncbi:MAG: transposase [Pirellulaceae bacterium]|nr:transposase [Pirellulaceae bacterium]